MEIAKEIKLITNVEVYQALKDWKGDKTLSGSGEFPWTKSAVMRYLEMTPACHLSDEKIQNFLRELESFETRHGVHLTPNEKMQMINIVPVQAVDIHTMNWFLL
ncbi:uncharacterized protein [Blastocystis hominis]|uniref:DNA-directed RNA polymerase III subunit RPC9 n=1 Tax=Blastocystis hominis TaxID=12968 RepID=D8M627_BLAHO|nr:uncharacterized protein [Blastocystis hominis]CBK23626.2 unnamed protein product [Blastocystis hominis]|eukprot:XP_012897674.1 uncharacterized protein [Blastocystis hominis]